MSVQFRRPQDKDQDGEQRLSPAELDGLPEALIDHDLDIGAADGGEGTAGGGAPNDDALEIEGALKDLAARMAQLTSTVEGVQDARGDLESKMQTVEERMMRLGSLAEAISSQYNPFIAGDSPGEPSWDPDRGEAATAERAGAGPEAGSLLDIAAEADDPHRPKDANADEAADAADAADGPGGSDDRDGAGGTTDEDAPDPGPLAQAETADAHAGANGGGPIGEPGVSRPPGGDAEGPGEPGEADEPRTVTLTQGQLEALQSALGFVLDEQQRGGPRAETRHDAMTGSTTAPGAGRAPGSKGPSVLGDRLEENLLLLEWVGLMLRRVGRAGFMDLLDYYEGLDWLDEPTKGRALRVAVGVDAPDRGTGDHWRGDLDLHARTLVALERLGGRNVPAAQLDALRMDLDRLFGERDGQARGLGQGQRSGQGPGHGDRRTGAGRSVD